MWKIPLVILIRIHPEVTILHGALLIITGHILPFSIIIMDLCIPDDENPSCLQTTWASYELHESSHTVPQIPLTQTSTRPSRREEPPTSLTVPLVQAEKVL